MEMDEVIRGIEQTGIENMQDVMQAAMKRYRELYPEWKILFLSAQVGAADDKSKAILRLIHEAEERLLYK